MGAFQGHLQGDVLSVLLDAGVLFFLRWSLDDTSDCVVVAAIQGFAAILIVPSDKVLDENYSFIPCALEIQSIKKPLYIQQYYILTFLSCAARMLH